MSSAWQSLLFLVPHHSTSQGSISSSIIYVVSPQWEYYDLHVKCIPVRKLFVRSWFCTCRQALGAGRSTQDPCHLAPGSLWSSRSCSHRSSRQARGGCWGDWMNRRCTGPRWGQTRCPSPSSLSVSVPSKDKKTHSPLFIHFWYNLEIEIRSFI